MSPQRTMSAGSECKKFDGEFYLDHQWKKYGILLLLLLLLMTATLTFEVISFRFGGPLLFFQDFRRSNYGIQARDYRYVDSDWAVNYDSSKATFTVHLTSLPKFLFFKRYSQVNKAFRLSHAILKPVVTRRTQGSISPLFRYLLLIVRT
jgi:hypothetical protein